MNIYTITHSTPDFAVIPVGNRYYDLADDTRILVHTSEGCMVFDFKKSFRTNFRSGGILVDGFVDQVGDTQKALIYLLHDAAYTPCVACNGEHPISRELADEFLRDGLRWAGMGKFKSNVVYYSVRAFGKKAYEEDDELTETNSKLFSFTWASEV